MNLNHRRRIASLMLFFILVTVAATFAEDLGILNDTAQKVLDLFSSSLVKTILTIALGGLAIGLIASKDNEAMKKRFIVWLVAVALLRGMTEVVKLFFGS